MAHDYLNPDQTPIPRNDVIYDDSKVTVTKIWECDTNNK